MKKMYFLIIIILLISGHLSSVSINIYAYIDWYGTVFEDGGNYFYVQNVNQGLKVGKAWGATSDYYRSFFCFDITSIPYNAEINSVILHANRYSVSAGNTHLTDVLGLDIYSNPGLPPEEMHNKISSGNLYVDNWDFMQLQYMYYPNEYEIDLGPNAIGDLELFLTYQFDFFPIGFKETGDNSTYGAINQNYTYCTINYTVPDPANLSLSNITIPNPVPYIGGSYTAQINNTGDGELYFAIDNLPSWVIINYNPDPIPGGSYTPININVEPNQSNNRSCSIRFYNTANQNNEEFLIINQEGQPINSLTNGSVTPNPGTTDDTFEFSVIFQSPAGQSPSDVTLHLDGATYSMNAQGSNWQNGVEFIKNISSLNQGNHSFYFTANNNDLRYPISGNLNLNVTQSAVGWDIAINVPNSSLSPNNIEPGDDITATVGVSNPGQFTYNNVPILVELRDPDGNLIDSENSQTGIVEPNQVYTFDLVVHLPSNSDDGLYSVILSLLPELDCNPSNNSHTLQFYIGGMIDTDQYIVEWGDLLTGGDYFYISGYQYHLYGAYSSSNEILVFDPYGDDEIIIENEIEFFNIGPAEQVIVNEGVFAQAGPDLAYLTVGHAVASGGPQFSSVEVLGYRGESIYFNATASSGCQFENNAGNYDCWTSSDDGNNYVDDWFNGVSSNTGYVTADFEFIIPSNASYGTHTFYFQTDYEDSGDPKYITKLKITILHSSPSIASLSSYEFSADDYITISGNDFSSVGQVFFGSLETSNITSWSNTSIVCEVPENVVNGNLYVVTNYGISNSVYYQIISSTGNPEIIQPIPDQEIIAGTSAIISDLNNVFWDPNNDVLQYAINYSSSYLTYNADSLIIGRLFMEAEDNVEEDVTISVTATDADSVSIEDIFILSIQDINDPPSIDPIPDQTFNEDESLTLDYGYFNSYVTDPDNSFEELILDIVDYGDLIIQNTGTQFIISAPADWFGFSTPLLSVSDGEYVTTMVFNITVLPINDPPILNISINCELYEDSLVVYNFYEFCDQTWGESDSLYLLSTSSTHIDVYIDDFFVTFVSNTPDWNGTEDITFSLDDNVTRSVVDQTIPVTVLYLNDAPYVANALTDFSFDEDTIDTSIDLHTVFDDVDIIYGDELTFSYSGNVNIGIDITNGLVTLTPLPDRFGMEIITFTATDDSLESASDDVEITVIPINDPPILNIIGTFEAYEDLPSQTYDFTGYCSQTWGETDVLTLSADNSEHINVTITDFDVVFESDTLNWNGTEDITFYLNDNITEGAYSGRNSFVRRSQQSIIRDIVSQTVPVTIIPVNDDPTIVIPVDSLSFAEDDSLVVDFVDFISDVDPDSLILSVSGNVEVIVEIYGFIVTFKATENWNGTETLIFTVDDNQTRATASDSVDVIVSPVNDPPTIILPDYFTFAEDSTLVEDFVVYIADVDPDDLTLSVTGNTEITVDIAGTIVTFGATENWNGTETLTFTVDDNQTRATASDSVDVIVTPVNDPPVNTELPVLSGEPYVNQLLSVTDGVWNDDLDNPNPGTITISYQWQESDDDITYNNIADSSGSTFIVPDTYYNKYVRCEVTATDDGYGIPPIQSTTVYSNSIQISETIAGNSIPLYNELSHNYPNPFNPETTIEFSLKEPCNICLEIYNIRGQKVNTLINEFKDVGYHHIIWNGNDSNGNPVSSGIYFYKLNVNGKTEAVKKCLLLK